ncbi:MAG: hypothetical protein ACRC2T_03260 [Thermoguttaceae bacterium]
MRNNLYIAAKIEAAEHGGWIEWISKYGLGVSFKYVRIDNFVTKLKVIPRFCCYLDISSMNFRSLHLQYFRCFRRLESIALSKLLFPKQHIEILSQSASLNEIYYQQKTIHQIGAKDNINSFARKHSLCDSQTKSLAYKNIFLQEYCDGSIYFRLNSLRYDIECYRVFFPFIRYLDLSNTNVSIGVLNYVKEMPLLDKIFLPLSLLEKTQLSMFTIIPTLLGISCCTCELAQNHSTNLKLKDTEAKIDSNE